MALIYDPLSAEAKRDPERFWRVLRDVEPVHRHVVPQSTVRGTSANPFAASLTTEFWTVLRHADVVRVLTDPETFPSVQGPGPDRMAQSEDGGVLIFADGGVHLRQRRLTARAFTPRAVERVLPGIQQTVDEIIDAVADTGAAELMGALALPLSMRTVLDIVGVPFDTEEDFHRWGTDSVNAFGGDADAIEAGAVAIQELFGYVQTLINQVRSGRVDAGHGSLDAGVLAALVRAEQDGSRLSDLEICHIVMQLVVAGYETTSTALLNGVHALITNPDERTKFESAAADGVNAAIEEVLRYAGPQAGLFRTAACDVEIRGCPIPSDAKVRVGFASANRDEQVFRNADEFRIDRPLTELRSHVAFGLGPHACIGAALARAELRIALKTIFRRLPDLKLDSERPPVRNDTKLTISGFQELHVEWDPAGVKPAADPARGN